jgi:hypothetical protein
LRVGRFHSNEEAEMAVREWFSVVTISVTSGQNWTTISVLSAISWKIMTFQWNKLALVF